MNWRGVFDEETEKKKLVAEAQAAGMWSEERVRTAIDVAVLHHDSDRIAFLTQQFKKRQAETGREMHPYLPDPDPGSVNVGEIYLGTLTTGGEVRMPKQEALFNTFLLAPPGGGKTMIVTALAAQLMRLGVRIHLFDTQNEYPHLLCPVFGPDALDYFDARSCRINPFDPPETMSLSEWVMGRMCDCLREAFFWHDRTVELFRTICVSLFEQRLEHITPAIFVEEHSRTIGRVPPWKQRMPEFASLERFITMLKTVEIFSCERGERPEDAAQRSRIYGIHYLPKDVRLFFVSHLVMQQLLSRRYRHDRPLDLVMIFDELNQFFTKETLRRYLDIGESFYLEMLRSSRRFGVGFILADQIYSLVHESARGTCQNRLAMDVRDAQSRREFARDVGLNPQQEQFLASLSYRQEQRRAVVQLHHYPFPFLMKVPIFTKPPDLTEEQLRERCREAVTRMKWEPYGGQRSEEKVAETQVKILEEKHAQILKECASDPFAICEEHAERLKMEKSSFSDRADPLRQQEFLRECEVRTYGRGRPVKLFVPTKKGYAYLDKLGVSYRPLSGNGSVAHRFWQHRIWLVKKNATNLGAVEFEIEGTGKQVDVGILEGKSKTAFEVVATGTLEKELSNLRKDIDAGWTAVVFCVESKEVLERLKQLVSARMPEAAARAEYLLLGDVWAAWKKRSKKSARKAVSGGPI